MSLRLISPTGQGTGNQADITPPLAPVGLSTDTVQDDSFRLTWSSNSEPDLDHYNVYRSTQELSGFSLIGQPTPAQTAFTLSELTAGTTYFVKMTAVDNAGNESEFSTTVSETPVAVFWDDISDQTVDDDYPNTITGLKSEHLNNGEGQTVTVHDRPVTGNDLVSSGVVSYDDEADTLTITEDPGGKEVFLRASENTAEADWQSRISGAGVVWYHDFRSDAEVDAFRWRNAVGNDPQALGTNSAFTRRITSDGITGACLDIFRPAGNTDGADWWRPYSPLQSPGNGRDTDDPGANGTLTALEWSPTQGGSTTTNWAAGNYGPSAYHGDGSFDGTSYFVQFSAKISASRWDPANPNGGKVSYFSRTNASFTNQEIVLVSGNVTDAGTVEDTNFLLLYRHGGTPLYSDNPGDIQQPGGEWNGGACQYAGFGFESGDELGCFWWKPDEWATFLFEIVPGLDGNNDTVVRAWAQRPEQTAYTKIWDQSDVDLAYSSGIRAHNALILTGYMNGAQQTMATDIYQRFCQVIFSKEFIPARGVAIG